MKARTGGWMAIPKKVAERLHQQLKRYQTVLATAKDRDVSESDTVVIVADMLADVFGYKKYVEITTEFAIRNTYVDLAIKVGDEVRFLVEVKAIGGDLKDAHVKQAVDYAANQGVEWVLLTNGVIWRGYHIHFKQPIEKSLLFDVDLLNVPPRDAQLVECFGMLSREAFAKDSMNAFSQQQRVLGRFSIAALLLSPSMLSSLRRELRNLVPRLKVEEEQLHSILTNDVLKRELIESDEATLASQALSKALKSAQRAKEKSKVMQLQSDQEDAPTPQTLVVTETLQTDLSSPSSKTSS